MASGTLYTYPNNFRANKILISAEYSKSKIKVASTAPAFTFGETNKAEDFLKKFPNGKVPAFETEDNQYIFESNAIAYYVANEQLRGKNVMDQAHIQQWISFADSELLPAMCTLVFPCLGVIQYNKQVAERARDDLLKTLKVLNTFLLHKTFLVGERITLADISTACTLLPLYQHILEPSVRGSLGNVNRWFLTLVNQPEFKAVIGEVKLCEKTEQFDAKKFADLHSKGDNKSKEKKSGGGVGGGGGGKEKKEKPKAAAPEPEEELDAADLALAEEPKSKDPFEKFPKGNLNMDDFKRVYSNESETVSVPYFFEKFDKDNFSIWYCEYKYPQELTLVFMSCNLISGMFQRLDKMRKNAFGSMILFGEDHNSTISGVWVWRGHELAFELSPDWQVDFESYTWKKLEKPDSEESKKLVTEYFSWAGDFGGKKFNQGKIFK